MNFRQLINEEKELNKPFRLPKGSKKKFGVYVKNDKGNTVIVKFGDPNMEIKRDDPDRLKAFRARHGCDDPGPKWKAKYWSCKMWQKNVSVSDMLKEELNFSSKYGKKNKWIRLLKKQDRDTLKKELYVLIDTAYAPIGGHLRIKNPDDILDPTRVYWEAIDLDNDPTADAVLFGKRSKHGIKISGWGHDGTRFTKSTLMKQAVKTLNKKGYWIEVSMKPAEIFLAKGVPYVDDEKIVRKVTGDNIEWLNDKGWYNKTMPDGKVFKKIIMGKPKV